MADDASARRAERKQARLQALYDGCTLQELSKMFHKNPQDVAKALRNVEPTAIRKTHPIWTIDVAAPYLMTPNIDIEEWLKKLRPNDLPPFLMKEFWAGKHSRLKFEEAQGELWPTADVMIVFSKVFKNLRSGLLLFSDMVEAQTDLTTKQRRLINRMIDELLLNLKRTLIDGDYEDDGKPQTEAENVLDA